MASINVQQTERLASALGGAALLVAGAKRLAEQRPMQAAVLTAVGAGLIWRGSTGHCAVYAASGIDTAARGDNTRAHLSGARGIRVDESISIARPASALYREWRDLTKMPRFIPGIASVQVLDERRSHWVATGPGGARVEWTAEIIKDVPDHVVSWRTEGGADLISAGSVHFTPEPHDRGTKVSVKLQYDVPGGQVTAMLAKLFGSEPSQSVHEGLRRFRQLMEAGEIPTTDGQSRGNR